MSYDDPNFAIRREDKLSEVAGAASASMAKVMYFLHSRLKKVHAICHTAGTNASAGVDIYVGTTSVGAIVTGTDTAGTVYHSSLLDADIPANSFVELKGKANSATMVHSFSLETEVLPDASET